MTKFHTLQNNSQGQHTHLPQMSPCWPQKGVTMPWGFPKYEGPHQCCAGAPQLHSCASAPHFRDDIRPSYLRHDLGISTPMAQGLPSPCCRGSLPPPTPTPRHSSTPLTLCRSSAARRNQQETNHFPDPDLAACPGTGVPEPAQKRSQDDVSGKGGGGGGGGGWDQPHAS